MWLILTGMPKVTDKTALQVLREGRVRLASGGWTQSGMARDGIKYCLLGALLGHKVEPGTGLREIVADKGTFEAAETLLSVLKSWGEGTSFACLFGWNDVEGRSLEDVLRLYDTAIMLAHVRDAK